MQISSWSVSVLDNNHDAYFIMSEARFSGESYGKMCISSPINEHGNPNMMTKRNLLAIIMCLVPILAFGQVQIQNIRVNNLRSKLQYVVDLTGMVPVTEHIYHHPYRKVFSFYHARLGRQISTGHLSNSIISGVKVQAGHNRVSIGFHFHSIHTVHASFWSANGAKGTRYVIDIQKHSSGRVSGSQVNFNRGKAISEFKHRYGASINHFVSEHIGGVKDTDPGLAAQTGASEKRGHIGGSVKSRQVGQPGPGSPSASGMTGKYKKGLLSPRGDFVPTKRHAQHATSPSAPKADETSVQLPVVTNQNFNEKAKRYSSKIIVVIDPGHGGKDPGATGPRGTHEKKVVLAIAKKLQKEINSYPGFKAVLTRGDDRYLTLRYRLALARDYHGDMFVAIHADAYINASAHGASVFALSSRGATSEAARWLAQRENQSELMGGVDLADKNRTLRSVLIDLSQTATIGASLKMGSGIITNLRTIVPMHANHVEQAAFVVLKSPDIPSLLIETGFISNPTEEQQLIMRSHQQKLAQAIAKGIVHYFKTHPPRGSALANQN